MRYTAVYRDLKGRQRSAGTFSQRREADRAWQRAEAKVAQGYLGDPGRGRQTFRDYVEKTWLPNHEIEASTRQSLHLPAAAARILPEFGPMRMIDILPEHVREWVAGLKRGGVKPPTIRYCLVVLSAIFTTALNDQVTSLHPCKGVKTPPVPAQPRTIITPEQFAALYDCLPDEQSKLLVETAVESGLRWGELTELRVRDLEFATRMLTVSRAVVQVHPKFHPRGRPVPREALPQGQGVPALQARAPRSPPSCRPTSRSAASAGTTCCSRCRWRTGRGSGCRAWTPTRSALGRTEPNAAGHRYRHGTLTGYSLGRCRCDYCRDAYCRYRAERRANGKDDPRGLRACDTDGHIPASWFRESIWRPAVKKAGLTIPVRIHDLRHAHASWLLAGGADLQVVKQRLGHGSLRTTEKYLHTLPDADETALEALSKMRNRASAV